VLAVVGWHVAEVEEVSRGYETVVCDLYDKLVARRGAQPKSVDERLLALRRRLALAPVLIQQVLQRSEAFLKVLSRHLRCEERRLTRRTHARATRLVAEQRALSKVRVLAQLHHHLLLAAFRLDDLGTAACDQIQRVAAIALFEDVLVGCEGALDLCEAMEHS
jgi:hypothetical protein